MLEGRMRNEQSRVIAPFIGKWMNLSVIVEDVSIQPEFGPIWAVHSFDDTIIAFKFQHQWISRLEVLNKGQKVNIMGRIASIEVSMIIFDSCELP